MKKKKILLAVLASVCVAAGAAGIAACSTGGSGDTRDPALYAAYQTYAAETENPKTYEEWVADLLKQLGAGGSQGQEGSKGPQGDPGERGDDGEDGIDGEDGVGIDDVKKVEINGKEYFEFLFSNGKIVRIAVDGSERQETTAFTVTAVDNNGDPVADAYFNLGQTDNFNSRITKEGTFTTNSSLYYSVKTNAKGLATFYTFPEEHSAGYSVYIADPYSISQDGQSNGVPKGYSINFGTDHGMNLSSARFIQGEDGNYSVTVNFIIDNSWNSLFDGTDDLVYKRYATDPLNSDEITEQKEPYVKRSVKGKYNYFSFNPYNVNMPAGDLADSVIDEIIQKARDAASGVYRFSWTANTSKANVQLNAFNFIGGSYFVSNEDGSPADSLISQRSGTVPTDADVLQKEYATYSAAAGHSALGYDAWLAQYSASFSGGNYVDLRVEEDQASASFCLGFLTDINCDVTITVERIGEVTKWTNTYSTKDMPTGEKPAMENDGRMIDVPLDSVIVKDGKGVYRLGSESGPEIYVQLTNPTRVNQNSMEYLTNYSTLDPDSTTASVFNYYTETIDEATNTGVRAYTDYTDVVKGYSALANTDGGYPVNDLIKEILENFCRGYAGWSNYDEYWVAACYYYGAPSDGTEASPYDLTSGSNSVNLHTSGTTYLSFRPTDTNYYTIKTSSGTLNVDGGIVIDGTVYVNVQSSQELVFTLEGSGTATVTIGTVAAKNTIEYSIDENAAEHGTEENPVACECSGVYQINIDHSAYSGKIVVDFTAQFMADGEYTFEIFGSSTATIEINGETIVNGSAINLTNATATRMLFDDVTDGTFFVKVTKVS